MATLLLMLAMIALFSAGSLVDACKSAVHGYEDDAGFHAGVPARAGTGLAALSAAINGAGIRAGLPPAVC